MCIQSVLKKVLRLYAVKLKFKALNNEAKYEALIVDLRIAWSMGVKKLHIYSDSQLVVRHEYSEY